MQTQDRDRQQILGILAARGLATSLELQARTGKSQPTVSRLLAGMSNQVLTLGRARATRYGLPKSIRGLAAQQPIHWTFDDGTVRRIGTLSLLANDVLHVETDHGDSTTAGVLPWFLTPLRAQGFLGRMLGQRLALQAVASDPDTWNLETVLFAALQLHDAPGAIHIGDTAAMAHHALPALPPAALTAALDALAMDVAGTLPAGSSAGGEQPKFITRLDGGPHLIVKFTPPKGTPFGDRWRDLLHAEALASELLSDHGVPVARTTVVESATRAYLLSERFDRVGPRGRHHVVSVGAAHQAFVAGSYTHWGEACAGLARGRYMSQEDAARASALLQFGRLIGNSDMHSGNLGLYVELQDLAKPRFALAPVYDMLPMRWRPDAAMGGVPDYAAFEPDSLSATGAARAPAHAFWERLARHAEVSAGLRRAAAEMAQRLR